MYKRQTIHGAVNFEVSDDRGRITVYTTSEHAAAKLEVFFRGERIFDETITVSPEKAYELSLIHI